MLWTASRLSRHCAAHHALSELNPRPTRDKAAAKGTAFHAALKEWRDTGVIPTMADDDVTAWLQIMVDNRWSFPPDGCEVEIAWGLDQFGHFCAVEEKPPESHVYVPIDGISDLLTAGRADMCWLHGDILVSLDAKTGRTRSESARFNLQVNAAGIALAQKWKARAYVPCLYYARDGFWDVGQEVEQGTPAWDAMLDEIRASAALDDKPHPGQHCSSCWEKKNCPEAAL